MAKFYILAAVIDCLRDAQNLTFTRAASSETDLLRAKPTVGLRMVIHPVMNNVLHGFDNG